MKVNKEMLKGMETGSLVDVILDLKEQQAALKNELDMAAAELQLRAERITSDRNIKFTEFSGSQGCCSVTTAQSLEVLNLPKLRELMGEELVNGQVSLELVEKQKFNAKFKEALTAIFLSEYNSEFTLPQVVHEIAATYALDANAEHLLLKKLKGDYKKDKKTLLDVIGMPEEDFNLDEELYYIYQIKKYELMKAYLDESQIEELAEQIRKCIIVEETVKVEVKPLSQEDAA